MSSNRLAFARRMEQLATSTQNAQNRGTYEAALRAKEIYLGSLVRVLPSRRLRNVGSSGTNLTVQFNVKGTRNPTALVRAVGPWQLVESDTRPHTILSRGIGRSKGRSKAARRDARQGLYDALFGGQAMGFLGSKDRGFAAGGPVKHPGTQGKHPWATATPLVRQATPGVFVRSQRSEMIRIFGGH